MELAEIYFWKKNRRTDFEDDAKKIRDHYKAQAEREIKELSLSHDYVTEEELEELRQQLINQYGPGEHRVGVDLTLKITTSPLYVVENEAATVEYLATQLTKGYRLAGKALTVSKANLNKFIDWLKEGWIEEASEVFGVVEDVTYRVSIKQDDE